MICKVLLSWASLLAALAPCAAGAQAHCGWSLSCFLGKEAPEDEPKTLPECDGRYHLNNDKTLDKKHACFVRVKANLAIAAAKKRALIATRCTGETENVLPSSRSRCVKLCNAHYLSDPDTVFDCDHARGQKMMAVLVAVFVILVTSVVLMIYFGVDLGLVLLVVAIPLIIISFFSKTIKRRFF
jgi:small-conductance mechanosensitive channel